MLTSSQQYVMGAGVPNLDLTNINESKKKSENKIILDDDNHQLSQQLGASRKTTWNSRIDREIL